MCLANNSCIKNTFQELFDRFKVLYKRKAHLHHYTKFMKDTSLFDQSAESILSVMDAYSAIDKQVNISEETELKRLKPLL